MSANGDPFICGKCGGTAADTGEIRTAGGALSAMFDVSSERFRYVSCARCGYTEFWRGVMVGADAAPAPAAG